MHYVYILETINFPKRKYVGCTSNLNQRLIAHNSGKCFHTAKSKPWKVKFYAAFDNVKHAQNFECYLKTGAGHSFTKKHFF
jgi:putative endonuclease